ncbi:MAG: transcription termination factor NusA [Butyricicoccus sp.]|jgi:N utilization substance protein A|nr:transcription termination factor NusA [Clostridiales bacterium]
MNAEFFAALEQLEKEKGIPVEYMLDRVCQALLTAYKKDNDGLVCENVYVEPDMEKRAINMYVLKEVVDEAEDPLTEISLEDAREINRTASMGDMVRVSVETKKFGRIAAQAAKQVIIQGIRESERGMVFNEYSSKEHEILSAVVNRIDPRNGNIILDMVSDGEKTEAVLSTSEQVAGEDLREGQRIKVYVVEVRKGSRGPQVMISRTHPGLVKRLFELEVPEIHDGIVEVKSIAREAGSRTKIAVASNDENVDPIGACVGPRGSRVGAIVSELSGEKIDIIKYSEDMATFVSEALSPADVVGAIMLPDGKSCRVIVPDDQLSLAIGKEGQNARLAAKLTGCKIDIGPESQANLAQDDDDLIAE